MLNRSNLPICSPYFFNAGLFNTGECLSRLGQYYAAAIVDSGIQVKRDYRSRRKLEQMDEDVWINVDAWLPSHWSAFFTAV
jgi:hypothetical protein